VLLISPEMFLIRVSRKSSLLVAQARNLRVVFNPFLSSRLHIHLPPVLISSTVAVYLDPWLFLIASTAATLV
jgi:hypothetical protein